jgi:hypothetical protein
VPAHKSRFIFSHHPSPFFLLSGVFCLAFLVLLKEEEQEQENEGGRRKKERRKKKNV